MNLQSFASKLGVIVMKRIPLFIYRLNINFTISMGTLENIRGNKDNAQLIQHNRKKKYTAKAT